MMRLLPGVLVVCSCAAAAACTRTPVSAAPAPRSAATRLTDADTLLEAGCLDCLVDAFAAFDALRSNPAVADQASIGAARSATLVALRERDLGMVDSQYLDRAKDIAARSPALKTSLVPLFEIAEALPARQNGPSSGARDDAALAAMQKAYRNRDEWTARLENQAGQDPVSAYLWLSFNCVYSTPTRENVAGWAAATGTWRDVPLVAFKTATCGAFDLDALDALAANNPRFHEIDYFAGLRAISAGDLDNADRRLTAAYAWHARWPAVTQNLANVSLTAEDFAQSLVFYDRTLAMLPDSADALVGRMKALTYLGRADEAIATADRLIAFGHWFIGDARYWRALNESQLARYDDAWTDVELAGKLLVNGDVPKLAGIIAYRRHQLDVSRAKFEEAHGRNGGDCEAGYYLQIVLAEQADWPPVADVAPAAAACFDDQEADLRRQIDQIRGKTIAPERQARLIARREQTIAANARMRAACWFNAAVSSFNLKRADDARRFGSKVADDEQYGGRTRELLSRIH
jgi:tetratricopeptide (TPR) repeat protein